ncbi:hypothetical protein BAE46_13180 [Glaciecola punicea]|jgi:hypothetical protein|uniref:hypothetical protein n=1 Tax=Glaciecola punicea TaxID=56804 RepID=UPI00087311A2|nr:hypothetical protein [Glaciecola punicea]OFA29836.1 hypothetical protein BAE46_13180 [Glaciecola punicea]
MGDWERELRQEDVQKQSTAYRLVLDEVYDRGAFMSGYAAKLGHAMKNTTVRISPLVEAMQ